MRTRPLIILATLLLLAAMLACGPGMVSNSTLRGDGQPTSTPYPVVVAPARPNVPVPVVP